LLLCWDLGCGSNRSIAVTGAWQTSTFKDGLTGGTKLIATTGANLYITGVQLEKGSTATSFDYRPYGTELQLAQRYFEKSYDIAVAPGTASVFAGALAFVPYNGTVNYTNLPERFKQTKRATPTMVVYNPATGATGSMSNNGNVNASAFGVGQSGFLVTNDALASAGFYAYAHYTASAEL
jgi:hypothetical protein